MDSIIYIEENCAISIFADEIIANKKDVKGYKNGGLVFVADSDKITIRQEKGIFHAYLYVGGVAA